MAALLQQSGQVRRIKESESNTEITSSHKQHPITFALLLSLEANHRSINTRGVGIVHGRDYQEVRGPWEPF